MKKAVLGCIGIFLCLGLLTGCNTTLVGPGLAYHEPGSTAEEKTEPGIEIPSGDVPEGDDPDGDDNGGTGDGGDNNPNNPDNPNTGDGGGSGDGGSGDGDGSGEGDPEESNTYTLAVKTDTIINNFKRNDESAFAIGSTGTPDENCQLEGYTFDFDDVFSITFTKEENGGPSGARLWSDGIRVYGKDDFTIAPMEEWKLSSITLTFAVNKSDSAGYVDLENVVSAGGTELSRGTTSPVTVSGLESYSSVVVTPDNGSSGNIAYSSIEVTCVK